MLKQMIFLFKHCQRYSHRYAYVHLVTIRNSHDTLGKLSIQPQRQAGNAWVQQNGAEVPGETQQTEAELPENQEQQTTRVEGRI